MNSRFFATLIAVVTLTVLLLIAPNAYCVAPPAAGTSRPVSENSDLFELSLGYNYIYLDDADPERQHLHGGEISAFWNLNSWLGLGGEFMADFGERRQIFFFNTGFLRFRGRDVAVNSERYLYVFGPRITFWRSERFRAFTEVLAGNVHAGFDANFKGLKGIGNHFSDDGFALVSGGGLDCRIASHISWRIIQADYLLSNVGLNWQHDFRASTALVFSFGLSGR
jgi:hypothetical protein